MTVATRKYVPEGVTVANYSRLIHDLVMGSESLQSIFPTRLDLMPNLYLRDALRKVIEMQEGKVREHDCIPSEAAAIIEAALFLRKFDSVQVLHNDDTYIAVGTKSGYDAREQWKLWTYVICQWGAARPTIAELIRKPRRHYYRHRLTHPEAGTVISAVMAIGIFLAEVFRWFGSITEIIALMFVMLMIFGRSRGKRSLWHYLWYVAAGALISIHIQHLYMF